MQQDETFAQWLETSANPMDPDGPQWIVSAWEHARCRLMEQRPDSDDERLTGADTEFLMGPVCEVVDHDRPGDFRADVAVAIDTYLHFLVHRGHDVAEAHAALAGRLPVLDTLDRVGYLVDTADPAEVEVLDGLPLTVSVRELLNRPHAVLDDYSDDYSDEWFDREFCRDVGLLAEGAVTAEGLELLSADVQVRRRAQRQLVARWVSHHVTGPTSVLETGGLEVFLAGMLAAVHGARISPEMVVCAAHLQGSVDDYRQLEPGWLDIEDLVGYLELLPYIGFEAGESCRRARPPLSTTVVLTVLQIADEQKLRRDEIAGWFAVFTGASPWVVDLVGAELRTAG